MLDDRGRNVASAGPSTPVSVIGLDEVPSAGDPVHVIKDVKKAQEIAEGRRTKERRSLMPGTARISLEDLAKAMSETDQLELKLIIKADVQGSVEALRDALMKLTTAKVKVSVVHAAVGAITEGDVNLAVAAKGIIIGFNVRPAGKASSLAQQEAVEIRQYSIIYNVVDEVKAAMEGLLAPTLVEKETSARPRFVRSSSSARRAPSPAAWSFKGSCGAARRLGWSERAPSSGAARSRASSASRTTRARSKRASIAASASMVSTT